MNVATKISSIETSLNGKQSVLTNDDDFIINYIVVKPGFKKGNYTEAVDGEIRCDILTVADVNISTLIASKQNTLSPGTNITIVDNVISSSGGGSITQEDLDLKQDLINSSTNLTCNTISTQLGSVGTTNLISGFELTRAFNNNIQLNSGFDTDGVKTSIILYNRNTGICAFYAKKTGFKNKYDYFTQHKRKWI